MIDMRSIVVLAASVTGVLDDAGDGWPSSLLWQRQLNIDHYMMRSMV